MVKDVFSWEWHKSDIKDSDEYAKSTNIDGFGFVALPQGLVASGFFANIFLLDLDRILRESIGREVREGVTIKDICRYVDDLRIVVKVTDGISTDQIETLVVDWLDTLMAIHAPGLGVSTDKTKATFFRSEEQPLIRQARRMQRIQTAISGGFDAAGGEDVIHAVQGLVRTQTELSLTMSEGVKTFSATPDVKDETLSRFAAGRFRKTYRSLRPLLENRSFADVTIDPEIEIGKETFRRARMNQSDLDEEAKAYSLTLLSTWAANPSQVRLLRVAVDIWPSREVATTVIKLLKQYLTSKPNRFARKVALYCMSEVFRAGATETGIVSDWEMLPSESDLGGYREVLLKTAIEVISTRSRIVPWYLKQQAILFLLVHKSSAVSPDEIYQESDIQKYIGMHRFLNANFDNLGDKDFAVQAVVARRSFLSLGSLLKLVSNKITKTRFIQISQLDLELANELLSIYPAAEIDDLNLLDDLNLSDWSTRGGYEKLDSLVTAGGELNALRNEIGILTFSIAFLKLVKDQNLPSVITPSNVQLTRIAKGNYSRVTDLSVSAVMKREGYRSIYTTPAWVSVENRWRFQLGFLIRFILTARTDYSLPVNEKSWKEDVPVYRATRSHWLQRSYGFYNGHGSFGDEWLPISQFSQDMLYTLLSWPGCRAEAKIENSDTIDGMLSAVESSLAEAESSIGDATGILMLKLNAALMTNHAANRPLRACVVQIITPSSQEMTTDITASSLKLRQKHRNHLSTALAAVEKMLDLRDTHKDQKKRLDFLILPELSVHPDDVKTHLVPFARAFKTIILAGLTYHELFKGRPLVNAAIWVVPRVIKGQGLQIVTRLQGKYHLAPLEQKFNDPFQQIMSFRPCQWLIGYEWSRSFNDPLWLTGSICYDATDI